MTIADVDDEGAEGNARRRGRECPEQAEALGHVRGAHHRALQVVHRPQRIESCVLGGEGRIANDVPRGDARVDLEIEFHRGECAMQFEDSTSLMSCATIELAAQRRTTQPGEASSRPSGIARASTVRQ